MKNVTLTLSGGGLRSLASIGVIEYLELNDFKISKISGTSGGAIVSLLYAFGLSFKEMEDFYSTIKKRDIFKPTFVSLCSLNKLEEKLIKLLEQKTLQRELIICITSLETGEAHYISSKDHSKEELIKATIASSSLLPFFKPVKINDKYFIDGGYSDNLPNYIFKEDQEKGIKNVSVNVNNVSKEMSFKLNKLIKRILLIVMNSNIRFSKERSDYFINVDTLTEMNLFDFDKYSYAVNEGFKKAEETIQDL